MGKFLSTHLPFLTCAGLCWSVWTLFKLLEREKAVFKRRLMTQVTNLIITRSSIFTILSSLPKFFVTAFDLVFTDDLYSWRGFGRSCKISVVLVLLLGILWYATIPEYVYLEIRTMPFGNGCYLLKMPPFWNYALVSMTQERDYVDVHANYLLPTIFTPFLYNFMFDYVSLIVTRNILQYSSTMSSKSMFMIPLIFGFSLSAIVLISFVAFKLATTISWHLTGCREQFFNQPPYIAFMIRIIAFPFYGEYPGILGRWYAETVLGVFVCSTLFGMVWIIMFSVGLILANLSMKIAFLGPWLDKNVHVRQYPFKIMGGLLAMLLFAICFILHLFGAIS